MAVFAAFNNILYPCDVMWMNCNLFFTASSFVQHFFQKLVKCLSQLNDFGIKSNNDRDKYFCSIQSSVRPVH